MIQCVRDLDLTFKSNGLHALLGWIYIVMVAHILHASRLIYKKNTVKLRLFCFVFIVRTYGLYGVIFGEFSGTKKTIILGCFCWKKRWFWWGKRSWLLGLYCVEATSIMSVIRVVELTKRDGFRMMAISVNRKTSLTMVATLKGEEEEDGDFWLPCSV